MKILLVEDSKFLRMSTERALTAAGYEVISASDGEQVRMLAREHKPALILLDVMLPRMSGPDVLRILKNDPATTAIPVMMLTGLSQKNATQMKKDGASSFFEKSDSMLRKGPDSLTAAIDRILKKPTLVNERNGDFSPTDKKNEQVGYAKKRGRTQRMSPAGV